MNAQIIALQCPKCGQVVQHGTRFCQCGFLLIRKCVNPKCLKEFPIDHELCDYCGWPQNIDPHSKAANQVKLERIIRDLSDPDSSVQIQACGEIQAIGSDAVKATPLLINILRKNYQNRDEINLYPGWLCDGCCKAFAAIGKGASDAISLLAEYIKFENARYQKAEGYRVSTDPAVYAIQALGEMGTPAIPVLMDVFKTSEESFVILTASRTLCKIASSTNTVSILIDILQNKRHPHIVMSVCEALCKMNGATEKAIPLLIEILKTCNRRNTETVVELILSISKTLTKINGTKTALPILIDLLMDATTNKQVEYGVQRSLVAIGTPALSELEKFRGWLCPKEKKQKAQKIIEMIKN